MILLSETTTNKYYGIEVPNDSFNFIIHDGLKKESFLSFSILNSILLTETVGHLKKPIILGVIGPEDSIPEEIVREIFPTMAQFRRKIKELGILIENPIEKPDGKDKQYNHGYHTQNEWFERDLKQWQSYQDKLKKVVIIKTDK